MLPPLLNTPAFLLLLAIGLLAPGWLLGRVLGVPVGPIGAFLGSTALLMNLVVALDAVGIPLDATCVAGTLGLVCALLALVAKRRNVAPARPHAPVRSMPVLRWSRYHWLLVPAALGFAAIVVKTILDPLSGLDTKFRWDFLAQEMIRTGTLRFYPAITSEDFLHYSWCDGIAPLVSSLYFWAYLSMGKIAAWATTPIVIGQAVLLFHAVYKLASSAAGVAGGCAALAILATSAALLSGVAIGQETGMTALALVATFLFIENYRQTQKIGWLASAGIAAGVAALAREYGIVFIALGGLALAHRRVPARGWSVFVGSAVLVAAPWYLRNWIKTGNPLYSHEIGTLFPTNPIYIGYMHATREVLNLWGRPAVLSLLVQLVVMLAGVPLVLGVAGCIGRWRASWSWATGYLSVVALWLWTAGQTSGGYAYSLRVLTPAIALGAVLGAGILAPWASSRHGWLLVLVLTLPAVDAAQRSLFMPIEPTVQWWKRDFTAGRLHRQNARQWTESSSWSAIVEAAERRAILTSEPFFFTQLLHAGGKPIPLYSPSVRFLFDAKADYDQCVVRLRAGGVRSILLPRGYPIHDVHLSRHLFFEILKRRSPSTVLPIGDLYDLFAPQHAARLSSDGANPP